MVGRSSISIYVVAFHADCISGRAKRARPSSSIKQVKGLFLFFEVGIGRDIPCMLMSVHVRRECEPLDPSDQIISDGLQVCIHWICILQHCVQVHLVCVCQRSGIARIVLRCPENELILDSIDGACDTASTTLLLLFSLWAHSAIWTHQNIYSRYTTSSEYANKWFVMYSTVETSGTVHIILSWLYLRARTHVEHTKP